MGSQRELEIGVLFGETYWKLFKFIEINKSAYFVIPYVLKMSVHPPKPPELPDVHVHWKDLCGLGIHQDVDSSCLTPECLEQAATDLLDSFSYYPPDSDEDVIVLPTGFIPDAYRTETEGKRERSVVDLGRIIEAI